MKTNHILLSALLLLNSCFSLAQNHFIKGITSGSLRDITIKDSNSFIAIGQTSTAQGFVAQLDESGNIIQSLVADSMSFRKVLKTSDNGFLIEGVNYPGYYCTKMDSVFNVLWTKRLPANPYIIREFKNQYYFFSRQSFGTNLITKTDASGNVLSQKLFNNSNNLFPEYFIDDAVITSDDNIMVVGRQELSSTNFRMLLNKLDTGLNVIWMEEILGFSNSVPSKISQTFDSTLIIAGIFTEYTYKRGIGHIKIDNNGNVLSCHLNSPAPSGNPVVASYASNLFLSNFESITACLVIEPTLDAKPITIKYDSANNYINSFKHKFPYSFIGLTSNCLSPINSERFYLFAGGKLMGMDTTLLSCISEPFPMLDTMVTLTTFSVTPSQPAFTATNLQDTVLNFQPYSITTYDYCQLLLSGENINQSSSLLSIYPNPATLSFTITFDNIINNGMVELYNVLGKRVLQENIFNESKKEIKLKNVSDGIYFVKVLDGEKQFMKKIIIQN